MIQRLGGAEARKTLAELCELYWPPLYAFARRQGWSAEDAEDLTQGFFARLLECGLFAKADPERGSLRSYLLGSFGNFISEHRRAAACLKRGGGLPPVPLDAGTLGRIERELASTSESPEAAFDRRWYATLLEAAARDLERDYAERGQDELFRMLLPCLAWNQGRGNLVDVAESLGLSHGAVRVAIVRMRHRLREHIERQVAQTSADAAQAEEELANLRRALGSAL